MRDKDLVQITFELLDYARDGDGYDACNIDEENGDEIGDETGDGLSGITNVGGADVSEKKPRYL